ncbi:MAG: hypothetical protein M1117_02975 [Candidatus Thermoplasmatota archaeon]|uniref:Uncharacterized protein n=1 Tax=Candidatus Sysuiplasma superficiale TaxID=2823368 RepID=A0A8J7YNE1_9ARCH|nr:hypothetical protein [Candidatus Sysuiplasma superficiale]MCL4346866.1 hypothetical protein [Candidatus Thermoplasmatota archaeon]
MTAAQLNREKLYRTLTTLDKFADGALSPIRSEDMRTAEHKSIFAKDRTAISAETTYALLHLI